MGGACSMHGDIIRTKLWLENLKGRDHLEDLSIDGRMSVSSLGK